MKLNWRFILTEKQNPLCRVSMGLRVQAIRRTAERAFLELGLRDYARIDGWVMLHSEAQHMEFLSDYVLQEDNPPPVPTAAELPLPGFGPLPEEEFLQDGVFDISEVRRPFCPVIFNYSCICTHNVHNRPSLVQEQLSQLGPVFESEPLDDYIYSPVHDRYFTPEQLEHATSLEVEEGESAEVLHRAHMDRCETAPTGPPKDSLSAARGDNDASFDPITTPVDTLAHSVHELVQFEGGIVVLAEVNPVSGLEQVRANIVHPALLPVPLMVHGQNQCPNDTLHSSA